MKIVDAIATILKHEGVKFLSCFPTTSIIQACAAAGPPPPGLRPGARRGRHCGRV